VLCLSTVWFKFIVYDVIFTSYYLPLSISLFCEPIPKLSFKIDWIVRIASFEVQYLIHTFILMTFSFAMVYSFPTNPQRRSEWSRAVRRIDPRTKKDWQPSKHSALCSEHFLPNNFRLDRGYTILKSDAIPTVFNFPQQTSTKVLLEIYLQFNCLFCYCFSWQEYQWSD
jgi:THAP domain